MHEGDGLSAKTLEKSRVHLLSKLTGPAIVWLASSDKWKAPFEIASIRISFPKGRCLRTSTRKRPPMCWFLWVTAPPAVSDNKSSHFVWFNFWYFGSTVFAILQYIKQVNVKDHMKAMKVQIILTVFGASIAFSGSGFILEFCVHPCQRERFSELNPELQMPISWMFSWVHPEYIAYPAGSSWLLRSWGKHSSVLFCIGCLTSGLQDTRWVHLPEKRNTHITEVTHHTHINISMVMRIITSTTLAFQARYCPKTRKISCCSLWASFSFETATVEDHARTPRLVHRSRVRTRVLKKCFSMTDKTYKKT